MGTPLGVDVPVSVGCRWAPVRHLKHFCPHQLLTHHAQVTHRLTHSAGSTQSPCCSHNGLVLQAMEADSEQRTKAGGLLKPGIPETAELHTQGLHWPGLSATEPCLHQIVHAISANSWEPTFSLSVCVLPGLLKGVTEVSKYSAASYRLAETWWGGQYPELTEWAGSMSSFP